VVRQLGYGDRRSFAVSRPSVWNSLPTALQMSDCSLTTFRTQLKTMLFIWYIVYRQPYFLTAGQRICSLRGILHVINSLHNNNNNNCVKRTGKIRWIYSAVRWLIPIIQPITLLEMFTTVQGTSQLNEQFSFHNSHNHRHQIPLVCGGSTLGKMQCPYSQQREWDFWKKRKLCMWECCRFDSTVWDYRGK